MCSHLSGHSCFYDYQKCLEMDNLRKRRLTVLRMQFCQTTHLDVPAPGTHRFRACQCRCVQAVCVLVRVSVVVMVVVGGRG